MSDSVDVEKQIADLVTSLFDREATTVSNAVVPDFYLQWQFLRFGRFIAHACWWANQDDEDDYYAGQVEVFADDFAFLIFFDYENETGLSLGLGGSMFGSEVELYAALAADAHSAQIFRPSENNKSSGIIHSFWMVRKCVECPDASSVGLSVKSNVVDIAGEVEADFFAIEGEGFYIEGVLTDYAAGHGHVYFDPDKYNEDADVWAHFAAKIDLMGKLQEIGQQLPARLLEEPNADIIKKGER